MNHLIEIEHLSKSFESKQVFKDLNLCLEEGESLVVMGKSGSGKTVLIKCIVKLIEPDEGKIEVFGKDLSVLNKNEINLIRKKIGFLFQNSALYDSMSVEENLQFSFRHMPSVDEDEMRHMTNEMLEHVGLSNTNKLMPSELSGGMRKRIALARTLIVKPDIILYDEPTTGLDPITSREICNLILSTQKKFNTSAIVITHDAECAKITGDRIIMINEGSIVQQGKFDELISSDDIWVRSFFE